MRQGQDRRSTSALGQQRAFDHLKKRDGLTLLTNRHRGLECDWRLAGASPIGAGVQVRRIQGLAEDYFGAAIACVRLLRLSFGRSDVLRAWRIGDRPQIGHAAWGHYEMHGYGCTVFLADVTIDVEFSDRGRLGFDGWRLWRFARQRPARWPMYQDLNRVERDLSAAVQDGIFGRARPQFSGEGNPDLYQLLDPAGSRQPTERAI